MTKSPREATGNLRYLDTMGRQNIPVKDMTVGAYFRTLWLMHLALTVGQTLFGGMALLIIHGQDRGGRPFPKIVNGPGVRDPYFYAALGLAFVVIATGHFLFRARVERAREKETLSDTLTTYRSATVLRDALANSVGALASVGYLATQNPRFLAISGLVILVFLVWWPTKEKSLGLLGIEGLDDNAVIGDADRGGIPRS